MTPETPSSDNLRALPHADEAEEAVLGGILLDAKVLDRVREVIGVEDFYNAGRRAIFQAMLTLRTEGQPIDSVTLLDRLRDEEKLSEIGSATYLAELIDRVPSAAYIDTHARIVRHKAIRRRLISLAAEFKERCYTGEDDSLAILLGEAERVFHNITVESERPHEEAGDAWPLEEPPARRWLIQGWLPVGRVTLLSGKAGQGKSRLALQLAAALASGDQTWLHGAPDQLDPSDPAPVVFCSWEDERDEIARKLHHMKRAESVGDRLRFVHPAGAVWGPAQSSSRYATTLGELTNAGRWVRAYCQQKQAQLLILDPLAAAYTCNENDRALVRAFMADWNRWAQETGCTVLIIAHPPKTGADTSGSTDWEAAPRAVWTFGLEDTNMGKGKEKKAPRLVCIKSSYAPLPASLWLSSPRWPLWEAKDATNAAVDWETFTKNRATPEATAPSTSGVNPYAPG